MIMGMPRVFFYFNKTLKAKFQRTQNTHLQFYLDFPPGFTFVLI